MKRREFLKLSAGTAAAAAAGIETADAQAPLPQSSLDKIKHVVVLMMENRSFDNILGKLYPASDKFDGLTGDEFNFTPSGNRVAVNNMPGTSADVMTTPNPNPGEYWGDINEQLFGSRQAPGADAMPDMGGFVRNYMSQSRKPRDRYDPRRIMHYFTPEQVPVISQLAKQFAVSDRWFASAPTQTWPNRFFMHCATANGYENNSPAHYPYKMRSIFERLHKMDQVNGWRIYCNDIPQSLTLSNLWKHRKHFSRFATFLEHASQGALPSYAFIEPDYFPILLGSESDEHPPSSVAAGEVLIASVYNALRQGPAWTSTLLVIVFDEHGGCYDHVPPPFAVPPSGTETSPFNFNRFGVRVPAVLISPYIEKGQIVRPAGATPFDHTSIIATLRRRFDLGPPMTDRDAAAPSFEAVLNLGAPDNLGPERIAAPAVAPRARAIAGANGADAPQLTDLQEALHDLSEVLPDAGAEEAQIRRLEALPRSAARAPGALRTVGLTPEAAGAVVDANVRRFLSQA